jgi:asparagine synthetase B (glutamine-hydrolysing)
LSGIVGMFRQDGAPVDRQLLQALTDFMSYRGPDASEIWDKGEVGLGHTLLKTTRQSCGERQPASLDDRLWMTADARLDERAALLLQLRDSSCDIGESAPDSELVLRSYATWGANCVGHLRGDFAFAIWDARAKVLFCARDHFGIKPFYYAQPKNLSLFSNTLNCLRAHPDVSGELNDSAIADFLLFGLNLDETTTTFRDVQRLPPAHSMTMDHLRPFVWPEDPDCRLPEPPDNPFFAAPFQHFHAIAQDCRVVLSGEGNDNLMYFQMWPYVQELWRNRQWSRLGGEGLRFLWIRPVPWQGIRVRLAGLLRKASGSDPFPPWIAPDFARRMNLDDRWRESGELRLPAAPHAVRPKAHASLALPHWTSMFENENAGVTRRPVEVRYPFLDLRLVDYLLAIPPFPWVFHKRLLREAMAGKLPESILTRPKTPFRADPLLAHFQRYDVNWINQTPLSGELERYINRSALLTLHGSQRWRPPQEKCPAPVSNNAVIAGVAKRLTQTKQPKIPRAR